MLVSSWDLIFINIIIVIIQHFIICLDVERLAEQDDPSALAHFLKTIGLEKFADTVTDNEISGDMIVGEKGEDVLAELEMDAIARLRVLVLYRRHLESKVARFPADKVAEFFKQHKELKESAKMILEYDIDGEMLLQASKEAVLQLGIPALGWVRIKKKFKDFALGGK